MFQRGTYGGGAKPTKWDYNQPINYSGAEDFWGSQSQQRERDKWIVRMA